MPITNNLPPGLRHLVDNLGDPGRAFTQPLPFKNNLPPGLNHLIEPAAPTSSRLGRLFQDFFSPTISHATTRNLIGVGGGFGLLSGLFTGGIKSLFSLDGLLNAGALACLIPGMQFLMPVVAAGFLAKAAYSVAKAAGCLLSFDLMGAGANLLSAGLTAICVLPVGKLAALKPMWNAFRAGEITSAELFLTSTRHLYGREAQMQLSSFLKDPKTAAGSTLTQVRDRAWQGWDWLFAGRRTVSTHTPGLTAGLIA